MNCPVCNRNNSFDLSICPSCGAMMNDTVREELLPKISISKPLPEIDDAGSAPPSGKLQQPGAIVKNEARVKTVGRAATAASETKIPAQRQTTENLRVKPTSPTLVEFHTDKKTVPEWRLQLQNAVRQRQERESAPTENLTAPVAAVAARGAKTRPATSGANALKIEAAHKEKPAPHKNPTLTSALARIEKSRQKFYVAEEEEGVAAPAPTAPRPATKNYPFYIAAKQATPAAAATPIESASPKSVVSLRNESGDLDTNKLPPLSTVVAGQPALSSPAKISTSFAKAAPAPIVETKREEKFQVAAIENTATPETESDEQHEDYEDCAPIGLRFNAGLFDLIIGAGITLLLLAVPFATASGETNWFSFTGALAFMATCSIVMFIYLTTTVGFYGRTFGMRLFSLEVVDIAGENYPTLHQSAVSAAVYLLSLAFGGAGFLTLFFNEERRAAHDLASGTIVVREI